MTDSLHDEKVKTNLIEKQEKLRKRRMAIAEASKTNPNLEAEDDEQ